MPFISQEPSQLLCTQALSSSQQHTKPAAWILRNHQRAWPQTEIQTSLLNEPELFPAEPQTLREHGKAFAREDGLAQQQEDVAAAKENIKMSAKDEILGYCRGVLYLPQVPLQYTYYRVVSLA